MSIIKGNLVGTTTPRPDWNETNPKKASFIRNKPVILNGEDGGYYTPSVSNLDEGTMTVSFAASKEGMPAISDMQVQLPRGQQGPSGLPWVDLGTFDDVMAEMDNLLEDGRYRLWTDDPFCYSLEVERVGEDYVGQTHWTSEEGCGMKYFRSAWYNGEEWEWLQDWTPHVTQDWLNQYALKTHKHRQAMNADFDSWIEVFREGQYQIHVQAESKSYIVDQFVFNNKPVSTIHVCQRYFEVNEPWIVYARHGTTDGNYVLVDWDEWDINVLDGEDGGYYTPEVTQSDDSTMTISFTPSKEGMPAVSDMQVQLPQGADGHTPVKGTDYFTAKEIDAVAAEAAGKVTLEGIGASGYDLLWENASRTSAFAAQTLNVSTDGYNCLAIEVAYNANEVNGSELRLVCLRKNGAGDTIATLTAELITSSGIHNTVSRKLSVAYNRASIVVNGGIGSGGGASDTNAIPLKIYGIKGV